MSTKPIMNIPVVQEFDGISKRLLADLDAIQNISTLDSLTSYELMLRNEVQALQMASTKMSRAVYELISAQREKLNRENVDAALSYAREILAHDVRRD